MILGKEEELYTNILYATDINLLAIDKIEKPIEIKAKVRYRAQEADAILEKVDDKKVKVTFKQKQRAITTGQSVVFYKDDIVIGGGKIL